MLHLLVTAADVQDRNGGILLLSTLFKQFPFLRKLFADSAYAGRAFQAGVASAMAAMATTVRERRNEGVVLGMSVGANGNAEERQRWLSPAVWLGPKVTTSGRWSDAWVSATFAMVHLSPRA